MTHWISVSPVKTQRMICCVCMWKWSTLTCPWTKRSCDQKTDRQTEHRAREEQQRVREKEKEAHWWLTRWKASGECWKLSSMWDKTTRAPCRTMGYHRRLYTYMETHTHNKTHCVGEQTKWNKTKYKYEKNINLKIWAPTACRTIRSWKHSFISKDHHILSKPFWYFKRIWTKQASTHKHTPVQFWARWHLLGWWTSALTPVPSVEQWPRCPHG